ncbi:C39 family peptidase [Sporanaerobacter acetigenes]|uniref:Peptidase_C39 like family protein n=1 Tax=Sporanaerobacter acetigenes DSM 13106 TaxID=1123281 RepID=A0A1M5U744_9FIRM|nr:C39 family peptidase [Sporanaerobacter acetigenes]SHH58676.1 Peptidase_C39 like family protein [Sporanaerobacter acetigenes DSM 13106]
MFKINSLIEEEARERKIITMTSIFVVKFLIFVTIFYILSSPFEVIEQYFSEEELEYVKDVRNEYGYEQSIDIEDEDYIYSSEFDFSSYEFQDSSIDIVYYNQADSRWKDIPYGKTGTIGRSGCGPTSLAMVVSTLSDKTVNPVEVCNWSYKNGYYCEGAGSYHSLIPNGAKHFGLKVEGAKASETEKIIDALSNEKLIIAIMGEGHFTSTGHFIVLRGITQEGKILVADPISIKRSEQEWDLSIILNEARKGVDAGGPFWIIGR